MEFDTSSKLINNSESGGYEEIGESSTGRKCCKGKLCTLVFCQVLGGLSLGLWVWMWFIGHEPAWIYFIVITVVTLVVNIVDKCTSKDEEDACCSRMPERLLYACALLGGTPAATLGIFAFCHNKSKEKFQLGLIAAGAASCAAQVAYVAVIEIRAHEH